MGGGCEGERKDRERLEDWLRGTTNLRVGIHHWNKGNSPEEAGVAELA